MILLSCMAMAVSVATDLLITGGLTRQAHAALVAAGPLGTGEAAGAVPAGRVLPACLRGEEVDAAQPAARTRWLPGVMGSSLLNCAPCARVRTLPAHAVVTEAAVHGLSSPIAFVAAIACSIAGVLLHVTAVSPGP